MGTMDHGAHCSLREERGRLECGLQGFFQIDEAAAMKSKCLIKETTSVASYFPEEPFSIPKLNAMK